MALTETPFGRNLRVPVEHNFAPTSENKYKLLTTGKEVIDRVVDRIGRARYSIDLQYYTFEADETGEKVIQALIAAKQKAIKEGRNLQIRLLADNSIRMFHDGKSTVFHKTSREKREQTYKRLLELQSQGIEVKITNYFHFPLLHSNPFYRDHKKIAIFDGKNPDILEDPDHAPTAIVGSANVSNEHYVWKDIAVEMQGNMIGALQRDFNETFQHARDFAPVFDTASVVQYIQRNLIHSNHRLHNLLRVPRDAYVSVVRNDESPGWKQAYDLEKQGDGRGGIIATDGNWWSRREATSLANDVVRSLEKGDRIDVVAPYPGMFLTTGAMVSAARKGAQVHEFSSEYNSYHLRDRHRKIGQLPIPNPIAASWEWALKNGDVQLHIYQGDEKNNIDPTIHAKFMLVRKKDGTSFVLWGSSNFNKGPLAGFNREIILMSDDPHLVTQFVDLVDNDLIRHSSLQRKGLRRTSAATSTSKNGS